MIFPILDGILPFKKAPVTWLLVLFNVFVFSQNWQMSKYCREQLNTWYKDQAFLDTQGRVYQQYKKGDSRQIASLDDNNLLGILAFKDEAFLQKAEVGAWQGDHVAIRQWQNKLAEYLAFRDFYPALHYGVSEASAPPIAFFSYQFFHEGFMHLFGNILLIMIVGGFLERRHSGLLIFSTYLLSGAFSAFVYWQVLGLNSAPLIGASGSLCGLIGFMLVVYFNQPTRLMYFILPTEGYYGFLQLRSFYWILWLCILEDISGFISGHALYSDGVSHFVHLVGFVSGIILAMVYLSWVGREKSPAAKYSPLPL